MDNIYDIIVIGCGPAGMAAALYSTRSGKKVLILEKETIGGQMALAPKVENYLSIESISGAELADKMFEQVCSLGVEFELECVTSVEKADDMFIVTTDYGKHYAKSVISCTGAHHKKIGVNGEEEFLGKGVSYCALCDGAFYKGEEVAVIGDGNTALQYALDLSNYCKKVTICTLFDKFFGDNVLVERLKTKENIEIMQNVNLVGVHGNNELETLHFYDTLVGLDVTLDVKGVFIAIGQVPCNDILKDLVQLDKDGYVIACEDLFTETPGLFVAGDCRTKSTRQISTAVADGAIAALAAVKYLG